MAAVADPGEAGTDRPRHQKELRLLGDSRGFGAAVAAREFLDPTRRIDELLFTREKRMASRTNADFNVLFGRTRVIDSTARTGNVGLVIFWMDARFHVSKRALNLGALFLPRKG